MINTMINTKKYYDLYLYYKVTAIILGVAPLRPP